MKLEELVILIATAVAAATPLVFAVIGETITERAGIVNLSADGTILLAGMAGFGAARATDSIWVGFLAAALVGAAVAAIVAYGAITLKQSQIAIGFILALLCADLSSFLGAPLVLQPGPQVPALPIPGLADVPIVGRIFFSSDGMVYASYLVIGLAWLYLYRMRGGLALRAVGEQPAAAFARGVPVVRLRYLYTILGGALIGIAGAAFTLDMKTGWTYRHTAGYGWIALAIVIFGGWNPLRGAMGAYLFGFLEALASFAQSRVPGVPTQVFAVLPFVLMILVLAATSGEWLTRLIQRAPPALRRLLSANLNAPAPAGLGKAFEQD